MTRPEDARVISCPWCGLRIRMRACKPGEPRWVSHDPPECNTYRTEFLGQYGAGRQVKLVKLT